MSAPTTPRNIYRAGVDRDTDEQVGVMFTPEMGRLVVIALNALAGGPMSRETFTEWGVRWTDGDVTTTQGRASESDAEDFVEFLAECGLAGGSLVSRTVTRTEWRVVSEAGAPDA